MRTSDRKVNQSLNKQIIKTFAQTVADLNNQEEALLFLKDFLTPAELETFAKRLAIAYWLRKGRSYCNIENNIKVSSATIAEVSSMMPSGGLKLGLKKIEAEEWANVWLERIRKIIKK